MTEKTQEWTEASNGAAANAPDEWQTVADEDQIKLENEGEGFIGKYVRMETVGDNGMVQAHFENVTDLDGNFLSERAFINAPRDLTNKLRTIPFGRQVRAQWTHSIPSNHALPQRMFSVASR